MSETGTTLRLDLAARLALRAAGDVEPNPMVGAVLVRDGVILGLGHHRRYGHLHAEREALADCRRRGNDPRHSTAFVTLEPCCHHGKQPPCTDALIEAGVARVVYARPDPHALSGGGAEVLRRAGIPCELCDDSPLATRISDPFVKRVTTGLPWVIAKWAQTADGRLVTRADEPRWISNQLSLKRVHRLRARVDAIVTGLGTVRADDPLLNARGVRRVRRFATRVILDPRGLLPTNARVLASPELGPVAIVRADAPNPPPQRGGGDSTGTVESGEVRLDRYQTHLPRPRRLGHPLRVAEGDQPLTILTAPAAGDRLDLTAVLRLLIEHFDITTLMLECGPTLLAAFADADLIDEALVYAAPAPDGTPTGADSLGPPTAWLRGLTLVRSKPLAGDFEHWFRRIPERP